jgi:Spy/CpxP family protein refolding chaperone
MMKRPITAFVCAAALAALALTSHVAVAAEAGQGCDLRFPGSGCAPGEQGTRLHATDKTPLGTDIKRAQGPVERPHTNPTSPSAPQ